MKNLNLLSRVEMRKISGGVEELPKDCAYDLCSYEGPNGLLVSGYCMSSINGKQCRCVADDGNSSVPLSACLRSY